MFNSQQIKFWQLSWRIRTKILCLLLLCLSLSSCATHTSIAPTVSGKHIPWHDREIALNKIQSWDVSGKVAVQTSNNSGSATVNWSQNHDHYVVALYGPLGTNQLRLIGQANGVTLITSDGKRYSAKDPESLLAKRWGFHLPISYLKFWIKGLPVSGLPDEHHLDRFDRIDRLTQSGYHVTYQSYTRSHGIDLPNRMSLSGPTIHAKLIVYQWHVS